MVLLNHKDASYIYEQADLLGKGQFAKVYKGTAVQSGRTIAVRLMPLSLLVRYQKKFEEITMNEINVLCALSDTPDDIRVVFISRVYDFFKSEDSIVIILEYCPGGNLSKIDPNELTEKAGLQIIFQLALGLQFLAQKKVIHGDIKPDNIISRKIGDEIVYKFCDFGFAIQKESRRQSLGTPLFMSPQIIKGIQYGTQVDVWAFGLLCYYLFFRHHYFYADKQQLVQKRVLQVPFVISPDRAVKISPELKDFMERCVKLNREQRLKSNQLTSHPCFDSIRQKMSKWLENIRQSLTRQQMSLKFMTAKGQSSNKIIGYSLVNKIALQISNGLGQGYPCLVFLRTNIWLLSSFLNSINNKVNIINHKDWDNFCKNQGQIKELAKLAKTILITTIEKFQEVLKNFVDFFQKNQQKKQAKQLRDNIVEDLRQPYLIQTSINQINGLISKLTKCKQKQYTFEWCKDEVALENYRIDCYVLKSIFTEAKWCLNYYQYIKFGKQQIQIKRAMIKEATENYH